VYYLSADAGDRVVVLAVWHTGRGRNPVL